VGAGGGGIACEVGIAGFGLGCGSETMPAAYPHAGAGISGMERFHIGVNFLGGGAADVDVEGIGFALAVEFAEVDEELGMSFTLEELFHDVAGGFSLTGLFDSELG